MGFRQAWLAVKGRSRDDVLGSLGLMGTGEREELAESPVVAADLPGGRTLVLENETVDLIADDVVRRLSAGCDVVVCYVNETTMFSMVSRWTDGRQIWKVTHDSSIALEHVDVEGSPPPELASIRDTLQARHASDDSGDVDYVFDISVELALALTGYRHDQDIEGAAADPFEVLLPAPPAKNGSWLKRIVGRS
jgi:hypothetical protein